LINKVSITPANITDARGGRAHVFPGGGAVYADKGYCIEPARIAAARKGVHLCEIQNNNMRNKNLDLDLYYYSIKPPL
jgi:transposase, IS5 family